MGGALAEQLAISGGAGVSGTFWRTGGGDFLFRGIRRPGEAEALSGVAGNQLGRRERGQWGKNRSSGRVECGRGVAGGGGPVVGVSARRAAEKSGAFARDI